MPRTYAILFILTVAPSVVAQTSPHGSKLKMDCAFCHTTADWTTMEKDMKFSHNGTSFGLVGQHSQVGCKSCHQTLVFSDAKTDCNSCHKDVHQNSVGPNCDNCHTPATWVIEDTKRMHDQTRFPLVGAHQNADCASCHSQYANLNFPPQDISCNSCHAKQYYATTAPNHLQAGFSTDCQDCHGVMDIVWGPSSFDHSFFPLVGGHNIQNCFACHARSKATGNFKGLSVDCNGCHQADYVHTTFPSHTQLNLSTQCQSCHNINGWTPATFDHSLTGFPLTGAHASPTVGCASCHKTTTAVLSKDCFSCHANDFTSASNPNHVSQGFPHECDQCHSTMNWSGLSFDHNTTGFPLSGEHANLQCQQCHASGYNNTPSDCYSCHSNDFTTATSPVNHTATGIPHACQDCHTTVAPFTTSTFNHATTGFALKGAHAQAACESCHKGTVIGTATDCYSCHSADFASTTNPNHAIQGFSHQCDQCHTTTDWTSAGFDHTAAGFPLTGEHGNLQCQQCHTNGYATAPPIDCYSCHSNDYKTATTPVNHVAAGLPHTCGGCHTIAAPFTTSTFNHATTGFTLTGAHTTAPCESCHKGAVTGTPTDCYSCHSTDFAGATSPNHTAGGFPHDCSQCHSTTSWSGATFDHSTTGFPLTGAHISVQCQQCHTNGYTSAPSAACVSCHQSNYNSTTNPSHVTLALSSDCTACHTTNPGWTPATFPIHSNYYVITGAHTSLTCDQCHNGNYNTASTSCYGCHQADYGNTKNPPHQTAGYPTDCTQCHTQTAWSPSTFKHIQFPITSGNHASPPLLCSQCHTTISNFSMFSCTTSGCHPAASTDPHHRDVTGYVYSPTSCYTCHPTGGGG